jgi:hypothetical protein
MADYGWIPANHPSKYWVRFAKINRAAIWDYMVVFLQGPYQF